MSEQNDVWEDVAGLILRPFWSTFRVPPRMTMSWDNGIQNFTEHWKLFQSNSRVTRANVVAMASPWSYTHEASAAIRLEMSSGEHVVLNENYGNQFSSNALKNLRNLARVFPRMLRVVVDVLHGSACPFESSDFIGTSVCLLRAVCQLNMTQLHASFVNGEVMSPQFRSVQYALYNLRATMVPPRQQLVNYFSALSFGDSADVPSEPTWKVPLMYHQAQSLRWMQLVEERMREQANFVTSLLSVPIGGDSDMNGNTKYCMLLHDPSVVSSIVPYHPDDHTGAAVFEERQMCTYHGAILADHTGSGKTAVALALLVAGCNRRQVASAERMLVQKFMNAEDVVCRIPVSATLVIVPLNLAKQWVREIKKFVAPAALRVIQLLNKRNYDALTVQDIIGSDLVIVSTSFLTGRWYDKTHRVPEYPQLVHIAERARRGLLNGREPVLLANFLWRRLMIDEAHESFQWAPAVHSFLGRVHAEMRWGLTGTPSFSAMSVGPLNLILQLSAVTQTLWPRVCHELIAATVRRTETGIDLPRPVVHEHFVTLTPQERSVVDSYSGLDTRVQISTCFNVIPLLMLPDMRSARAGGGGGAAANSSSSDDEVEQPFVLLTLTDLARVMTRKHQTELHQLTRQVELKRAEIEKERGVLAAVCAQTGDNMEELLQRLAQQEHVPSLSVAVRSSARHIESLQRSLTETEGKQRTAQSRIAFFQTQVEAAGEGIKESCPICFDSDANVMTPCAHWFCESCISTHIETQQRLRHQQKTAGVPCPVCKAVVIPSQLVQVSEALPAPAREPTPPPSPPSAADAVARFGSKLTAIVALLRDIKARGERAIMFVQWNTLMSVVRATFRQAGLNAVQVYGNANTREHAIQKMQSGEADVLLLSLENSASGLNLVEANHVLFAHALTHSNSDMRRACVTQAVARVQRLGQSRQVHVHWFISSGIEEETYRAGRD